MNSNFDTLCASGEVAGPASGVAINQAQEELGVVFPTEYKTFLEEFGAVIAHGIEIYGLLETDGVGPPLWQDVVSVTKQLRNFKQDGAEQESFIPISEDGTGVYFFINTEASPNVEIWAIGPGVKKIVSNNFYDFAVKLSQGKVTL